MNKRNKEKRRKQFKLISLILKLTLLFLLLIAIPVYLYFFHRETLQWFSNIKAIEHWILQYKGWSILVIIGVQILQIIICIIPGQAIQFASGYLFGFWAGVLISLAGAVAGSVVVYYLSRFLGKDAIHTFFGEKKITEMLDKMNSKKGLIITFIIFLIPGVPKDLCSYAAGLSDLKLKPYLIVSIIGRTPGMMGSLIIGRQIGAGAYTSAIVVGVIAVLLFILGVLFKERMLSFVDRVCNKLLKM